MEYNFVEDSDEEVKTINIELNVTAHEVVLKANGTAVFYIHSNGTCGRYGAKVKGTTGDISLDLSDYGV